jgi:lactoylglutathione lyase
MKIEHIAIWTTDLERLRAFYQTYFEAAAGQKYTNPTKGFQSYFLRFATGARLELMTRPTVTAALNAADTEPVGYTHLAFSLGSEAAVDAMTERLRSDGYAIIDGPRRTGDGYYESAVLDPDGNRLELTV